MEQLPASKLARYIGIANFSPKQVDEVLEIAMIKPKVIQIELHPYLPQQEFVTSLQKKGITVNAYAPLGNTNPAYSNPRATKLLEHQTIKQIASKRSCTPAQVVLAWNMRRNVVVIPKAVLAEHHKENYEARICQDKLTAEDDAKIMEISKPRAYRFFSTPCALLQYKCFEGTTRGH
jgi:alcohol dehydrogenase (NADP+)